MTNGLISDSYKANEFIPPDHETNPLPPHLRPHTSPVRPNPPDRAGYGRSKQTTFVCQCVAAQRPRLRAGERSRCFGSGGVFVGKPPSGSLHGGGFGGRLSQNVLIDLRPDCFGRQPLTAAVAGHGQHRATERGAGSGPETAV